MERRKRALWTLRWCSFFASVAITALTQQTSGEVLHERLPTTSQPSCSNSKRHLILVSTMDGKVSALNAGKEGALEWSIEAGDTPLVSSSIGNLEVVQDGVKSRIIPSLSGTLFQFDGQSVKPMHIDADMLMSSSFRMADDTFIVGGKETITYGIDLSNGKLKYVCAMSGCTKLENDSQAGSRAEEDVLVVVRQTRTIRAVEMRTGQEKWNFSVGQHEVSLIQELPKWQEYPRITEEPTYHEHTRKREHPSNLNQHRNPDHMYQDQRRNPNWEPRKPDHYQEYPNYREQPGYRERAGTHDHPGHPDQAGIRDQPGYYDQPGYHEQYFYEEPDFQYGGFNDEDATIYTCDDTEEDENPWLRSDNKELDIQLKLVVPDGVVMAVNRNNPNEIIWTHQFASAIATAWTIVDGDLQQISIFDEPAVPALQLTGFPDPQDPATQPLLYIGQHSEQYYCQESMPMQRQVSEAVQNIGPESNNLAVMPVIRWRPYIATARSRTPASLGGVNPLQIEYERRQAESQSLVTWHRQYPYDNGYYLFPDTTPLDDGKIENESEYAIFYNVAVAMPSLWLWWKEVLAISIGTAIIFNIVLFKYYNRLFPGTNAQNSGSGNVQEGVAIGNEVVETPADIVTAPPLQCQAAAADYISRYCTEFDQKVCLGRGGFGVVFEAVNKMDDCNYAIKRITLNNSNKARERVMREVKALAKLDHGGIVRYYQAWFESPPQGWQEERDRQMFSDVTSMSPTDTTGAQASKLYNNPHNVHEGGDNPFSNIGAPNPHEDNPLGMNIHNLQDFTCSQPDSVTQSAILTDCDKKKGSSLGFVPGQGDLDFTSSDAPERHKFFADSSLSIEFRNSDSDCSKSVSVGENVPFQLYDNELLLSDAKLDKDKDDSFSVVFEDSGCGDKDSDSEDEIIQDIQGTKSVSNINIPKPRTLPRSTSSPVSPYQNTPSRSPPKFSMSLPARPSSLDLETSENKPTKDQPTPKLYLYIQMQLCRRETLKDWLNDNTLNRDCKILLDIFDQIVSAVDYIHDCGLMHRDLKPSNIFFSPDGTVKVGDFGLVTAFEEQPQIEPQERTPIYYTNITNQVGTKLYMSPEQAEGKHYTHKVDIYSLGLILFELFYPFSTQMERVVTMQDVRKFKFPHRFAKELPDVMYLVQQLLAQNPSDRPSSKDIQQNPLLKDFEAARQIINRMRPRKRTHTMSTSESSNSEECISNA